MVIIIECKECLKYQFVNKSQAFEDKNVSYAEKWAVSLKKCYRKEKIVLRNVKEYCYGYTIQMKTTQYSLFGH